MHSIHGPPQQLNSSTQETLIGLQQRKIGHSKDHTLMKSQHKNNSGLGFPLQKRITHVNNAYNVCTGRREEQREDWRWAGILKEQTGRQNAKAEMQQEGSQALIPLVGNNS